MRWRRGIHKQQRCCCCIAAMSWAAQSWKIYSWWRSIQVVNKIPNKERCIFSLIPLRKAIFHDLIIICHNNTVRIGRLQEKLVFWFITRFCTRDILSIFDMQPGTRQHQLQPDSSPAGEFLQQMVFFFFFGSSGAVGSHWNTHQSFWLTGCQGSRQHRLYIDHP